MRRKNVIYFFISLLVLSLTFTTPSFANDKVFIDPGHGGVD